MDVLALVSFLVIGLRAGASAMTISMNQNIIGLLGSTPVQINCSYVTDPGDVVFLVNIKTRLNDTFKSIVSFSPFGGPPQFLPDGFYLIGRANLSNPIITNPTATLTLTEVLCEDENEYLCEINYQDGGTGDTPNPLPSTTTNLTVKAAAEKPESPVTISGVNGTIIEGQNVTFTCSGVIGNPPGKFVWEKFRRIGFFPTTYPDEETVISPGSVNCTNNGTSSLTIAMEDGDDGSLIRCVIDQPYASSLAFQQTGILEVLYAVRNTFIYVSPPEPSYIEGSDPITLSCSAAGNPNPTFAWYREGNDTVLSRASDYVISDVRVDNSGNYICVTENVVDGVVYNDSLTATIIIGPNVTMTTPQTTPEPTVVVIQDSGSDTDNLTAIIGGSVAGAVAVAITIFICKRAFAKKGDMHGQSQGQINHYETTVGSNVPPAATQQIDTYSSLNKSGSNVSRL